MKTYEVNIKLKRNRMVTVFLSPNKDEDIFVDEKASGVPFQLIEGKRYYFELSDADFYIDGDSQIIKCYPSRSGVSNGEITTGSFVGTFSADIKAKETNESQGKLVLEIRSTKIGYEDDYRKMMEDITEYCTELLMQQSSPVTQNYTIDKDADPRTQYERFAFVKSLVESESFEDAITQIETQPIVKWEDVEEERPTQSVRRLGNLATMPLGSPTLQKRAGYREILQK